jgi:hypothetical protein
MVGSRPFIQHELEQSNPYRADVGEGSMHERASLVDNKMTSYRHGCWASSSLIGLCCWVACAQVCSHRASAAGYEGHSILMATFNGFSSPARIRRLPLSVDSQESTAPDGNRAVVLKGGDLRWLGLSVGELRRSIRQLAAKCSSALSILAEYHTRLVQVVAARVFRLWRRGAAM